MYTSLVPIEWKDCKINFIDTPGYLDFAGEAEAGIAAGDSALIVVNARDVIQSGTIKIAWERSFRSAQLPTIFFINKLDEEHTSFEQAYEPLRETFGKSVIPFEVPIVENGEIIGSVNVLRDKAWYYKGPLADPDKAQPVPEDMVDAVDGYKDQIAEAVAMGDDELMEKFFSGESFTEAELTRGVRLGVRNGEIRPVFSGSALQSIGIERLMDLIIKYFPAYGEGGNYAAYDENGEEIRFAGDQ
ncbi:MAG: GTP-binding protein [Merdibacter sp.]